MILIKEKFKLNAVLLTNIIFGFFPVSFIIGNLFINLNLFLFCCFGIYHLRSKIFITKYETIIKIIFIFFLIIFFSTSLSFIKFFYIDGYDPNHLERLIKSISFFRFFLLFVVIYFLSQNGILNTKYFLIAATFLAVLISLDVIFQYIFGFNIIGLNNFLTYLDNSPIPGSEGQYNSSFFGDEKIAGGYITKFSFFAILFLSFTIKKNIRFILLTTIISVLGTGILLSGNRMPILLFMLGLVLIFIFSFDLKKIIAVSFICLFIIFSFISSIDERKVMFLKYFYYNAIDGLTLINKPTLKTKTLNLNKEEKIVMHDFEYFWITPDTLGGHTKLVLTALDIWKKNKIFGNGIKSFRVDCIKLEAHTKNRLCSNHPHNYYVEIITETGILGLFTISLIGLLLIAFVFKNFRHFGKSNKNNIILLASVISILTEAFPLRSTGSIFTTNNATYFMIVAAILLIYKSKLNSQN